MTNTDSEFSLRPAIELVHIAHSTKLHGSPSTKDDSTHNCLTLQALAHTTINNGTSNKTNENK